MFFIGSFVSTLVFVSVLFLSVTLLSHFCLLTLVHLHLCALAHTSRPLACTLRSPAGLRVDHKLYVANIGDSRCMIVRRGAAGTLEVVALSYDHKPDTPKEKERILRAGGRVQPLPGMRLLSGWFPA